MSIVRTGVTATLWDRARPVAVLLTAGALSVGTIVALAGTIQVGH